MGDFFFSLYPPILKVLGAHLELPDIIRVAATCRYGYHKWVDKIQIPFGMPNKIRKFYPRLNNGVFNPTLIITCKDLREYCMYHYVAKKYGLSNPSKCISCDHYTHNDLLCNLKPFPHGVCVICFGKERNKYYSLIRVNDAVSKMIDWKLVMEESPFDILSSFSFALFPNGDRVLWVRDFHKILQSLKNKKLKII